ncbi:MAG: hypothetical protein SVV80_14500, partial [Planctomycetota bacterium]|nr:hypothetical protein [Planctomycetota bacterium]
MANKNKESASGDKGHEPTDADVYRAMRLLGWTVPECEDDVRRAEVELSASATPLPESLTDAGAVFEGQTARGLTNVKPVSFSADPATEENLARAARQGGKIPPEIEQRMQCDRQEAEREL